MSKTLVLEIPDDVFVQFQKVAASKGKTAEKFVMEFVINHSPKQKTVSKTDALKELMRFAGAVSSNDTHSADNEKIDADLAKEYGKDL